MGHDSDKNLEHLENLYSERSVWDDRCRMCDVSLYDEKHVCEECQERLGIPDE